MLCVTAITIVQVNDRDYYRAVEDKQEECSVWDDNKGQDYADTSVLTELIKGHAFCNIQGERVYIGQAEHVQQALGLPFSAFQDMGNSNLNQRMLIAQHKQHIDGLQGMNWRQRLRFLFTKETP